jgi:hypothetical protein
VWLFLPPFLGGCGTAHVGTPKRGNTNTCSTHQAASTAISVRASIRKLLHARDARRVDQVTPRFGGAYGPLTARRRTLVEEFMPMRPTHDIRRADEGQQRAGRKTPILIVPRQTGEAIRRRREIRESFHDSKALVIKRRTK